MAGRSSTIQVTLIITVGVVILVAIAAIAYLARPTAAGPINGSADATTGVTVTVAPQPQPTSTVVVSISPGPTQTTTVTAVPSEPMSAAAAIEYLCTNSSDYLPNLINAASDPWATRNLQEILITEFGEDPGPVDGQYGPLTVAAVTRVQARLGVAPDGQVGPITWRNIKATVCGID